jgi:membrane dipeptidase
MNAEEIHRNAIVVDGLVISKWSREVFEDMHSGGITAVNCTCSVWEGLHDTLVNVAQWKSWFSEHADILLPVHATTDIDRAKRENRVGIILGWQNTSGIEDRLNSLPCSSRLG